MKSDSRARHKTINHIVQGMEYPTELFLIFHSKHGLAFGAIVYIIQLCIELEVCKPFMVHYDNTHIY